MSKIIVHIQARFLANLTKMLTMSILKMRLLFLLLLASLCLSCHAQPLHHHQLRILLYPDQHRLKVEDQIRLPPGTPRILQFSLHRNLSPTSSDATVEAIGSLPQDWLRRYRVTLPSDSNSFTLHYAGTIFHPPQQDVREARSFENSPGIIAAKGVVLSSTSGWYPIFEDALGENMLTFSLDITLPQNWLSVSQGERNVISSEQEGLSNHVIWQELQPQDEIYLIAAPFVESMNKADGIETLVYLRHKNTVLAQRYLDATSRYLAMYQQLIGNYPYAKFALVENFWETGYGMPSFTLLGSQVIRLPFIVDTSYPHEILHNWWGNGVYVDYQSGNWAEGLTAYLADHLLQEKKNNGAEYRRSMLQKYTNFVSVERDFPLSQFISRHSARSEAVGYGKTMMVFHMLRKRMGEKKFIRALQNLYRKFKFKRASYADIEKIFSQEAGEDLNSFFVQWVQQAGAPILRLVSAVEERTNKGHELILTIEQTQPGTPYVLDLPVAITVAGRKDAHITSLKMSEKLAEWRVNLKGKPLRVDVDPEFDIFRRLDSSEIPPALSQVFGAEKMLIVLPSKANKDLREQYLAAAKKWQLQVGRSTDIFWDDEIKTMPVSGSVWIFGWENRWRGEFQSAHESGNATLSAQSVRLNEVEFSRSKHALVLTGRVGKIPAAWLAVPDGKMMQTLARKLPHYSKYSYAAFDGDKLTNFVKGIWPLTTSSLSMPVRQIDGSTQEVNRGLLEVRTSLVR